MSFILSAGGSTGGGGSNVVPNPSGTVSGELIRLGIDGNVYSIPTSGNIPIASPSTLGGVKIGSGVNITSDGTISVSGGSTGSGYTKEQLQEFFILANDYTAYKLTLRGAPKNVNMTVAETDQSPNLSYTVSTATGDYADLFFFHKGANVSITYTGQTEPCSFILDSYIKNIKVSTITDIIPYAMTSNTTPKGECSASAGGGTHMAWYAFNKTFGNFWAHDGTQTGYLQYNFPEFVKPQSVSWYSISANQIATIKAKVRLWDNTNSEWVDCGDVNTYNTSASVKYAGENGVHAVYSLTNTFFTTKLRIQFLQATPHGNCNAGYVEVQGEFAD
jgi:hypothetical protein